MQYKANRTGAIVQAFTPRFTGSQKYPAWLTEAIILDVVRLRRMHDGTPILSVRTFPDDIVYCYPGTQRKVIVLAKNMKIFAISEKWFKTNFTPHPYDPNDHNLFPKLTYRNGKTALIR